MDFQAVKTLLSQQIDGSVKYHISWRIKCAMLDEKSISDDSILNIHDTLSIYARSIQQGLLRSVEVNWR